MAQRKSTPRGRHAAPRRGFEKRPALPPRTYDIRGAGKDPDSSWGADGPAAPPGEVYMLQQNLDVDDQVFMGPQYNDPLQRQLEQMQPYQTPEDAARRERPHFTKRPGGRHAAGRAGKSAASSGGSRGVAIVLTVVLCSAAIFLGIFLTDKWLVPTITEPLPMPTASVKPSAAPSQTAQASANLVVEKITMESWDTFMVQIGAFVLPDNADRAAENIKEVGGAGYILRNGGGFYRVMSSAFASEYDASIVKEQIKDQMNISAEVYTLKSGEFSFNITASKEQIETIQGALEDWPTLLQELEVIYRNCDNQQTDGEKTAEAVNGFADKLAEAAEGLKALPGAAESPLLSGLYGMYDQAARMLYDSGSGPVEVGRDSGRIKFIHAQMAWDYRKLVETLTDGGPAEDQPEQSAGGA
ncbi:MAG: SPOR domain-containing protein [Christensenellales bacterium]|jgi:cell division septation protein DedD